MAHFDTKQAQPAVKTEQQQVVVEELKAKPLLDEQDVPVILDPSTTFLFGSKSMVIPPQSFEAEETAAPDVFFPSSKLRFIDAGALIEPTLNGEIQPIED